MRRSIATVCVSGTLDDKLTAAASAGFDGIELFENDLVVSPWSPVEVRSRCADLGLTIDLYQPFRDLDSLDDGHFRKSLDRARRKFDVMAQLGVDTVLVCSSVAPDAVNDDDLLAAQLAALADRAADHGMRIAYEALAWGRHVSTWDRSWEIVRRADHPALGLCLDSFHVLSREVSPDPIAGITPGKIFFLQLADAPHLRMDVLQWSRHHRLFPGQGAFDLPGFVRLVLAAGYDGPLSLEVFNDVFRQADPTRTAVDAMRSLVALEDQLTIAGYDGSRTALRALPPAPDLTGHAFTEFAVDGRSGPELRTALRGLGFLHTGQHRTKPVELWEQHSCRVILNSAVTATGPAAISAFAVTSVDPAAALARAEALRAPAHPNVREPGEAELAAITAPDGTQVFVTGPANPWRADFLPTGAKAGGWTAGEPEADDAKAGAGLLAVDHLGLAQPFDHFDEAGLFYHSVLGLDHLAAEEYAAPFGLMRSRAVADPARRVRVALTVSLLRRGEWAPAVSDPQHVAFATADLLATAEALDLPALPVPDNYYDDLAARFALDAGFVATLRKHGILYDRDANGGELLHLYTPVIGGRVFFEIVERRAGYDRFGEPNAPVRMAAQRHRRLTGT
ncbi:bifunctional sugar phosphate isomerase/epimerase/4-hydroxyphenylpyruvate dioxygenase family protein [Actinoplanes derwentensis]|uniref:3-dehydroshikimate dehydratase n=1 Tax=Actinoplanes derwentensis TaxID=113562 RepID=A0A1H2D6R9_9ACTN|nr:sugar phosphate isomerase/epimerase and 4-hydroxyphenylpyruvate domain-containing protein [Actinoplanes derwentensis]GID89462.1 4-hydroxyphenylpyruvate dioxygenase [Actinoplanes derwentensis]SDT78458.1 4-hydroxyphenylpyruvate dioxygenase [Actinoplanes derwentensis]